MRKALEKEKLFNKYPFIEEQMKKYNIDFKNLQDIYSDYMVEFYPTNQKVIAEIQVRTIFEEGYGEIDHRLRYSHNEIPEILKSNLLLFNRIVGSADEMASLINNLNKEWSEKEKQYKTEIIALKKEIETIKSKTN